MSELTQLEYLAGTVEVLERENVALRAKIDRLQCRHEENLVSELEQARAQLAQLQQIATKVAQITAERDLCNTRIDALFQERINAYNTIDRYEGQLDQDKARLTRLQQKIAKFLTDTNAIPPWESAGALWAQRLIELQRAWLDSQPPMPAREPDR